MNITKIISSENLNKFPYNYRFIKAVIKGKNHDHIPRDLEIEKLQCSQYDIFFYKSISRIQ